MAIVWSEVPPPRGLDHRIGIIALEMGESVQVRPLGPVWWVRTHWVKNRSVICEGDESCAVHDWPATQKGAWAVESWGRNWRGRSPGNHLSVLLLTPQVILPAAVSLTGKLLLVSRMKAHPKSPLCVSEDSRKVSTPIPDCFDPRPYALRAMRLPQKSLALFAGVA
jgi:hypothetical protein